MGALSHTCEDDIVCKSTSEKVPYFNAPIFLENKQQVGKVDEIFGPIQDFVSFSSPHFKSMKMRIYSTLKLVTF